MGIHHAPPRHAPGQEPRQGATRAAHRSASPRAVDGRLVQAALIVGAARDRFEIEADHVAEQVIARLGRRTDDEPADRRQSDDAPSGGHTAPVAHLSRIQRSVMALPTIGVEGGAVDDALASRIQRALGAGHALPDVVRSSMEDAFGAELDAVRIHAGSEATALNQELGARAFTVGSDIFFGEHQFQPGTLVGQRLLAHELAHTLQQGATAHRTSDEPVRRNGDPAAGARAEAAKDAALGAMAAFGRLQAPLTGTAAVLPPLVGLIAAMAPELAPAIDAQKGVLKTLLGQVTGALPDLRSHWNKLKPFAEAIADLKDAVSGLDTLISNLVLQVETWEEIVKNLGPGAINMAGKLHAEATVASATIPSLGSLVVHRTLGAAMSSSSAPAAASPPAVARPPVAGEKYEKYAPEPEAYEEYHQYAAPPEAGEKYEKYAPEPEADVEYGIEQVAKPPVAGKKHAEYAPEPPARPKVAGKEYGIEEVVQLPAVAEPPVVAEPQAAVAPEPVVPIAAPRPYPKLKQKDVRYTTESTEGSKDLPGILRTGEEWVAQGKIGSIDLYMIKHFGWAQADVDKYVHQKQKAVVSYLEPEEREAFELHCGSTITQGPAKTVFDTSNMFSKHSGNGFGIYVMSKHGQVYADQHKVGLFHHSSFLAGGEVAAAGELKVAAGTVRHVTNKTGHYLAGPEELWQLLDEFRRSGVGLKGIDVTLVGSKRPYFGGAPKFYADHDPAKADH